MARKSKKSNPSSLIPALSRLLQTVPSPSAFSETVNYLIRAEEYTNLAKFFRLSCDTSVTLLASNKLNLDDFLDILSDVYEPWDELFRYRILVQKALRLNKLLEAVEQHKRLTSLFLSTIFAHGNYAHLPILYALLEDLADLSMAADEQCRLQGLPEESLQSSMQLFQSAVSACLGDRSNRIQYSKKKGALKVVNIQMKIFFQADQTALVSKLIETLNHRFPKDAIDTLFTKAEVLTYRYFYARDCLLNDCYVDAETWFGHVFENLPSSYSRNTKMVLLFYIPLRIAKGFLPSSSLLKTYQELDLVYQPIVEAIKHARMSLFLSHIEIPEIHYYLRRYSLLDLVDSLRWFVLRRVVKKTYLLLERTTRITLDFCQAAFSLSFGSTVSETEAEMLLSTLIEMDLIKGYISHEHQTMVLSAQNPFPVIKDQLYTTFLLWDTWAKLV